MLGCSGALVLWCSCALVLGCSGARVLGCSGAQVRGLARRSLGGGGCEGAKVPGAGAKVQGALVPGCSGALVLWCAGAPRRSLGAGGCRFCVLFMGLSTQLFQPGRRLPAISLGAPRACPPEPWRRRGIGLAQHGGMSESLIPKERIARAILVVRGPKVLLDADLAALYQVTTAALVRAVMRNRRRFPEDFMFQLVAEELDNLKCQIGISSWGGRRSLPYAFTEQGVAMLSSVLRSERAVDVNVEIMRAFVDLRKVIESTVGLSRKLDALERKYDGQFKTVFEAIRQLMTPPNRPRRKIGFK